MKQLIQAMPPLSRTFSIGIRLIIFGGQRIRLHKYVNSYSSEFSQNWTVAVTESLVVLVYVSCYYWVYLYNLKPYALLVICPMTDDHPLIDSDPEIYIYQEILNNVGISCQFDGLSFESFMNKTDVSHASLMDYNIHSYNAKPYSILFLLKDILCLLEILLLTWT